MRAQKPSVRLSQTSQERPCPLGRQAGRINPAPGVPGSQEEPAPKALSTGPVALVTYYARINLGTLPWAKGLDALANVCQGVFQLPAQTIIQGDIPV